MKKVLAGALALSLLGVSSVNAGYKEMECSSDPIFNSYSCDQCFDGGTKAKGDIIGNLSDQWINDSDTKVAMLKSVQEMPEMHSLSDEKVVLVAKPSGVKSDFWEYTKELEALKQDDGYVLNPKQTVTWIKSKPGYGYRVDKADLGAGENLALLEFTLTTNNFINDEITTDSEEHKECVLYKAAGKKATPTTPQPKKPTKTPSTGPAEYFVLLLLAMILAFGVLRFRKG